MSAVQIEGTEFRHFFTDAMTYTGRDLMTRKALSTEDLQDLTTSVDVHCDSLRTTNDTAKYSQEWV